MRRNMSTPAAIRPNPVFTYDDLFIPVFSPGQLNSNNLADFAEYLDAQRSYRATELAYRHALGTYMLAVEQLKETVGTRRLGP